MIDSVNIKCLKFMASISLPLLLSFCSYADEATTQQEYNQMSSHGEIYVFGTLTESTCQMSMASQYQSVDMGNLDTSHFKSVGDQGIPVQFYIELQNCPEIPTEMLDVYTDTVTWSQEQPGIKVKFTASTSPLSPDLIKVVGIEGLALQLSDDENRLISVNKASTPQLLMPKQDALTFNLTPVRTMGNLQAGFYRALIAFELVYD